MIRRGWIYLALFIMLQAIKSLTLEEWTQEYGEGRIEVKINEDKAIDFDTLVFNEAYNQIQPAVLGSRLCKIKAKAEANAVGIGTNSFFNQTEALQLCNGAFFGPQAVKEGRNVVVISDELSRQLFGSDKGMGNVCVIDGTTYQVVGVYKKHKKLVESYLDDGKERIYFPITSKSANSLKVQTLLISSKNRNAEVSINQLQEMQINSENSFIYNALDAGSKLRTLAQIPLNLLALLITWDLIRIVIRLLGRQNISFKSKLTAAGFCVMLSCLILSLGIRPLYIPPEALPVYNIFDVSFYSEYFKTQCAVYNYLLELHLSDFTRVYCLNRNIMIVLSLLQIGCCLKIRIKKEIFFKEGKEQNGKENGKDYFDMAYDKLYAFRGLWSKD